MHFTHYLYTLPKASPFYFLLIVLGLLATPVAASNTTDHQEIEKLLALLSEQTTLATQTRLNSDFVPGMMSIMSGEEMERKGFLTLWDAMGYLPGVQRSIDSSGMRSLTVRGVSQANGSAKVRLLLNNVVLNSSSTSSLGTLLDTPVKQIKTVEFIRGPGSAIHGEFALTGVINVITRNQGKLVAIGLGSDKGVSISGLMTFNQSSDPIYGSVNISANETDGEMIKSGKDRTPVGINGYAPGLINNKRDHFSAIVDLHISDLDLLIQYQQNNRGDYFGFRNYLPPPNKKTVISDTITTFNVGQKIELSDQLNATWSLNHSQNLSEKNTQFLGVAEIYSGLPSDNDIVSDLDIEEHRSEAKVNLKYTTGSHKLFTEYSFVDLSVKQYQQSINLDPITGLPDSTLNPVPTPVNSGQNRTTSSFVVQDEFEIDDYKTITAGFRYDKYDDIKNNVSPRIAFVWRLSQRNIFKAQYAEAFRPPTLLELNGAINGEIKPEIINTSEVSFIHIDNDYSVRNTIHYSTINDLIAFHNTTPFGYSNFENNSIAGFEFEFSKQFTNEFNLSTNLNVQDNNNPSSVLTLNEIPPWFLSTIMEYKFQPRNTFNLLLQYIPETDRTPGDTQTKLPSLLQADISFHHNSFLGYSNLEITGSVKNLLGEDIRFASPIDTYPDDYLYSDSPSIWIEMTFRPE